MPTCIIALLACAGSSQGPIDAAPDQQSATDASPTTDAVTDAVASDAPSDVVTATDSQPNEGLCASCTANKCLNELQACGGSQTCTNDLVTFNDCLSADQSNCGTSFAAGGSAQASLWACLASQCASVCGST